MYKPVIFSAVVGFIGVEIARKMFIKHFKPMRCKECYSPISRINCSPQFFYTWNFFNASIMLLFISFFLINNSKNSFTNTYYLFICSDTFESNTCQRNTYWKFTITKYGKIWSFFG